MKRIVYCIIGLCGVIFNATAQPDVRLQAEVRQTGYIHRLLPLDYSKSYERFGLTKKVLRSDMLCDMEDISRWEHFGIGAMRQTSDRAKDGRHSLCITAPTHVDEFPEWGLGLGTSLAAFNVGGQNWENYNRLHFFIYPDCEGARTVYLNLYVKNEGKTKVPDIYGREGYHEINLINHQWNECFIEITELPRDSITSISFAIEMFGRERTMGDSLRFDVDAVSLQTVANPEIVSGWQPAPERIIFSTSGYRPDSRKTAIANVSGGNGRFQLLDAAGKSVFEGKINNEKTAIGSFQTLDFSAFNRSGQYSLKVGNVVSAPFFIHSDLWDNSAWRVLNFIFSERCGYPVPNRHSSCHTDLNGVYNGHPFTLNGGWHDAGDMSQFFYQTGEVCYSLFEMAESAKAKGHNDLAIRINEEALWGMDFVLKARLGNGNRVTSWVTNLWTDGFIGTMDDANNRMLNISNSAFDNFGFAALEAFASTVIDDDAEMKHYLHKIAEEDFAFAVERYENDRREGRTRQSNSSQFMALASWSASNLYRLTQKAYYAEKAAEYIRYVLDCQQLEPLVGTKIGGFFYQTNARKAAVHFNHQSREQLYMQALTMLCRTQPTHADFQRWKRAVSSYGGYLKALAPYNYPYGMLPAGIYDIDEIKDSTNFYFQQFGRKGNNLSNDFIEQLNNGVKLNKSHYLRRFPVWFSFKGNTAVHLSMGKAAALCGKLLGDADLMKIAEEQLFWTVGKNPFGQSLIWGEGSNYAQQYCALPGETVGEIPVGIQTRANEDRPYWPQFNTATYKEVWMTAAQKWMTLIAEF